MCCAASCNTTSFLEANLKPVEQQCIYKTCHKQYIGSTYKFWAGFHNYRCTYKNYFRNKKVKQESFHTHFAQGIHQGERDWEIRLLDETESVDNPRQTNLIGKMNRTHFS